MTTDDLTTVTAAILKASGDHEDSEPFARYALDALAAAGRLIDVTVTESLTDEALTEVHRWHAIVHPALADRGVYEQQRNPSGCDRIFCLTHVVECSAVAAPRWYDAGRNEAVAQLVSLADRLDADCAGHGVASAISPGLRNAADVLTGESWLLRRPVDAQTAAGEPTGGSR